MTTGKVAFNHVHGMSLFEFLSTNADASDLFNRAMTSFTEKEIGSILGGLRFFKFHKDCRYRRGPWSVHLSNVHPFKSTGMV